MNEQKVKHRALGIGGESFVVSVLKQDGYVILAQNYTTRYGEVDIIAQKEDIVSFVEVKTRSKKYFPISVNVNKSKQSKLVKTAKQFILKNNIIDKVFRFDVAAVEQKDDCFFLTYIPNAFLHTN